MLHMLLASNSDLTKDPTILRIIEIQKHLEKKSEAVVAQEKEIERLGKRQERLRKNIGSGSQDPQTSKWRSDLGKSEDLLVSIEEEIIPALHREVAEAQQQLDDELKNIALAWQAE